MCLKKEWIGRKGKCRVIKKRGREIWHGGGGDELLGKNGEGII
jgi:hypothetical protein